MPSKESASRNWQQPTMWEREIRPLFPATYQEQARRLGAWTRRRGVADIEALLQALLGYVLCARSLRQLGAWATLVGLGSMSAWAPSRPGLHLGPGLEQADPPLDRLGPVVARRPGASHQLQPSWAGAAPAHPSD
jgi:hypothetical protein